MFNTFKGLLWLGAAVTFCLGAITIAFDFGRQNDETLQIILPLVQIQKRSVAVLDQAASSTEKSIIYSGSQVLYGLRGWSEEGAEVSVEGTILSAVRYGGLPGGSFDDDLTHALSILDLRADYRSAASYDGQGRLTTISLYKL